MCLRNILLVDDHCQYRYNGWYGGFQLGYDTNTAKLVNNNVAVGYQGQDFTVHASV